jgi:hypothetical protein
VTPHVSKIESLIMCGWTSLMISGGFDGEHKLKIYAKYWRKGTDFVELVYNSQLLQFMGKVHVVHLWKMVHRCIVAKHLKNGEDYALLKSLIGLQIVLISTH